MTLQIDGEPSHNTNAPKAYCWVTNPASGKPDPSFSAGDTGQPDKVMLQTSYSQSSEHGRVAIADKYSNRDSVLSTPVTSGVCDYCRVFDGEGKLRDLSRSGQSTVNVFLIYDAPLQRRIPSRMLKPDMLWSSDKDS
jgi:hypothetical protein